MTFVSRTRRGNRWDRDPLYLQNRAIIRAQRRPCARCGGRINYDAPYFRLVNGRKRINRDAFVCGHIKSRAQGGTHALSNLQAEHAGCSIRSGAQEGAQRLNASRAPGPTTTGRTSLRRPGYLRIDDW